MGLRVCLAGGLRLEHDGLVLEDADVAGRQVRLLCSFLLLAEGRAVPRRELADVLWDGRSPPSWEPALRNVLARVRALLVRVRVDPAALHGDGLAVRLALPPQTWIDVSVARADVTRAEQLLAHHDAWTAVDAARDAERTAALPVLPGEDAGWAEALRVELRAVHLRAVLVRGQAHLLLGEHADAARAAQELLAREPLLEGAHQLLLRALGAGGQRAQALQAYDRYRHLLVAELGVGPSVETEWVYLTLLDDGASPRPTPSGSPPAYRLVGRDVELAVLARYVEQSRAGVSQVVLLTGEPGVGKTALARVAADRARHRGALVLSGTCDPDVPVPYQPFAEALDQYVAATSPAVLRQHLGWCGPHLAPLVLRLTQVLPELSLAAAPPPEHLFEAVAALLRSVSAAQPVVLQIDDAHAAGAGTLQLLRYLVRALSTARVLLLVGCRDDDPAAARVVAGLAADLGQHTPVHRVHLQGLGLDAVERLLHGTGDTRAAQRLLDQTGGNPFLLTELLQQGRTRQAGGGLQVPERVADVLGARLRGLDVPAQRLLQAAATLEDAADERVLQALSGLGDATFLEALEQAEGARLLVPVPGAPSRAQFPYTLLRATVRAQTSSARREHLRQETERLMAGHLDACGMPCDRTWSSEQVTSSTAWRSQGCPEQAGQTRV